MSKPVIAAAALLAGLAATLSACNGQPASNQQTTSPTTSQPASAERLTAQLKTADGTPLANATFEFANGYATVTVEAAANQILTPGFHGLHIHSVGKCEANSVAPTGGASGDFNSAGAHFQVPGHTSHPASGDLTSLEVRKDGAAKLVTTTDSFTAADLLAGEKTALIVHQDADNFAHIPERYTPQGGAAGPDQQTLATGDAGKRVACGVIGGTSATATTTTTTTTVPTITETVTTGQATTTTTAPSPVPTTTTTGTTTVTVTTTSPSPTTTIPTP